jgi:hypothetical protein
VKYTFQCVLMINLFNEKVYIFIWFWLVGLTVMNALNLVSWFWGTHFERNRISFVQEYLVCFIQFGQ